MKAPLYEKIKKVFAFILICTIIAAICFGMRAFRLLDHTRSDIKSQDFTDKGLEYLTEWEMDGKEITLPNIVSKTSDEITITYDANGKDLRNQVLIFDNNRQGAIVSINDEIVYQVNQTELIKSVQYTDYQMIHLDGNEKINTISITFTHPLTSDFILPEMYIGSYYAGLYLFMTMDVIALGLLFLLAVVGVIIFGLIIYLTIKKTMDYRLYSLLVFVLLSVLWGYTDSYLPVMTTIPQEILGIVNYISVMSLPIPISIFAWQSAKTQSLSLPILSVVGLVNLLIQIILSSFGIVQLQNTFYSAFVLIAVVIVEAARVIFRQRRINPDNQEQKILFYGLIVLMVSSVLAIGLYLTIGGIYYRDSLLLGIFIFLILLTSSIIARFMHFIKRQQEEMIKMEMYERFSLYDDLTGLLNRRSYEKKLEEIEEHISKYDDVIMIMMDLNNLKFTNDTYGHVAGDDLLVCAAKSINKAYGGIGSCYRIGGDEFVVIIENPPKTLNEYHTRLEDIVLESNKSSYWKVSIAKGLAHLVQDGLPISIREWKQQADKSMYDNKLFMKKEKNI